MYQVMLLGDDFTLMNSSSACWKFFGMGREKATQVLLKVPRVVAWGCIRATAYESRAG